MQRVQHFYFSSQIRKYTLSCFLLLCSSAFFVKAQISEPEAQVTPDVCRDWIRVWDEEGLLPALRDVIVTSEEVALAVGDRGTVLAGLARGREQYNWVPVTQPTTQNLLGAAMVESTGWIVGANGTILKKPDNQSVSEAWEKQESGVRVWLQDVHAVSKDEAWVVGAGGTLLHTQNGGKSWQKTELGTKNYLRSITMNPNGQGYIVGSFGSIFYTRNGGMSWDVPKEKNYPEQHHLYDVYADKTGRTAFAVGLDGLITITSDYGATWRQIALGGADKFYGIDIKDNGLGWIAGEKDGKGVLFSTNTWGQKWEESCHNIPYPLYAIGIGTYQIGDVTDEFYGFVVGAQGHLMAQFDTGDWQSSLQGDFKDISFINESEGWATGAELVHTTNGGASWLVQQNPEDQSFRYISFANAQRGWVANQEVLLATQDGGTSWKKVSLPEGAEGHIQEVVATGSQAGCIATYKEVFKTLNGGASWEKVLESEFYIHGMDFSDAATGWVATYPFYLYSSHIDIHRTNNGGQTWEVQEIDRTNAQGMYIPENIYLVGEQEVWVTSSSLSGFPDYAIHHSRDNGSSWQEDYRCVGVRGDTFCDDNISALDFTSMQQGWAVGSKGILKYTGDDRSPANLAQASPEQLLPEKDALFYPNPVVSNTLHIHLPLSSQERVYYRIVTQQGKQLMQGDYVPQPDKVFALDMASLKGKEEVYILTLWSSSMKTIQRRLWVR